MMKRTSSLKTNEDEYATCEFHLLAYLIVCKIYFLRSFL